MLMEENTVKKRTRGVTGFGMTEEEAQFSSVGKCILMTGIDGGGAIHMSDSENAGRGESCLCFLIGAI